MADEELFGLDDELPGWAEEDVHDIPADDADDEGEVTDGPTDRAPDRPSPGRAAAGLPPGVSLLPEGQARYFTQRVTAPPMVDCMFAALCTPLSFMGYGLPASFVGDLRRASGVPRFDAAGRPQGTNTAATRRALRRLLPDAPVKFGGLDDGVMLGRLGGGELAVRVMVVNQRLPPRLRRFVGRDWVGLHAVAMGAARRGAGGRWEVRWMDPAGRPAKGYDGEFVAYDDVRDALTRTATGRVRVTLGEKNAALPTGKPGGGSTTPQEGPIVKLLTNGRIDEFANVPRGTPFLHPETGEQVTTASEDAEFRLAGRSRDGRLAGIWVNTRRVPGASGLTLLLVDVERIGEPFVRS